MTKFQGDRRQTRRALQALTILVTVLIIAVLILITGVGLASAVGLRGDAGTWNRLGSVGEAFGVVNSILGGLGLAAILFTFWIQFRELRSQRDESSKQRESLNHANEELYRTAEANLRRLHLELIRMAIDDDLLAEVWPRAAPDISPERHRQYLYANLVVQHTWLALRIGDYRQADIEAGLRHIFRAPLMREFWAATAQFRKVNLVVGNSEYAFAGIVDEICSEYDAVLSSASLGKKRRSPPHARPSAHWA